MSKGSVGEARNQLYIALSVGYITQKEFDHVNYDLEDLAKQIGGFIVYLVERKKEKQFVR